MFSADRDFCFLPTSHKLKMSVKLRTEYGPVLHMPTLKETREKVQLAIGDSYEHYTSNQGSLHTNYLNFLFFVVVFVNSPI